MCFDDLHRCIVGFPSVAQAVHVWNVIDISQEEGNSGFPDLDMDAEGSTTVVWSLGAGDNDSGIYQSRAPLGGNFSAPQLVPGTGIHGIFPALDVASDVRQTTTARSLCRASSYPALRLP